MENLTVIVAHDRRSKYMGRDPDAEKSQALKQRLSTALDVLDKKLRKTKFMAGDVSCFLFPTWQVVLTSWQKLTLVDLFYVPYVHHLKNDVWPSFLDGRFHLAAWWKEIESLSSYKVVFGFK
jgi:glutathione S-transferase